MWFAAAAASALSDAISEKKIQRPMNLGTRWAVKDPSGGSFTSGKRRLHVSAMQPWKGCGPWIETQPFKSQKPSGCIHSMHVPPFLWSGPAAHGGFSASALPTCFPWGGTSRAPRGVDVTLGVVDSSGFSALTLHSNFKLFQSQLCPVWRPTLHVLLMRLQLKRMQNRRNINTNCLWVIIA